MIKHKYKAKPCEYAGIKFASKKEFKRYQELELLKKYGEVVFFLRQIPIHLPAGVKYILDYQVFWSNGEVTFEDVKGIRTPMYGLNYRSGAKANWKHEFVLILAKIWHFSKNYLIKNSRKSLTHSLSFIYLEGVYWKNTQKW